MNNPNPPRYARLSAPGLFYLLLVAILIICAATFFYSSNTGMEPFDDEGFFLITLRDFARGKRIFEQFYTIYGPVHYLYLQTVFALLRLPFDQAGIREAAMFSSLLVTALLSAAAYKLTDRPVLAATAGMFIGKCTEGFGSAPGHPGESILVIVATLLFFLSAASAGRTTGPALAAAAALVCLCKFNIGLFVLAAALVFAAWRPAKGAISPALFSIISTATMLLPLAMAGGVSGRPEQIQYFLSIEIGFMLTIAAAFNCGGKTYVNDILAAIAVFIALVAAGGGLLILSGISAKNVAWGLFLQHAGIWSSYELLPPLSWAAGLINISSIAFFLCRNRLIAMSGILPFLALIYGMAELLLIYTNHPVTAFQFGLAFLWLPALMVQRSGKYGLIEPLMALVFVGMFLCLMTYPRILANDWQICFAILSLAAIDRGWRSLPRLPLIEKLESSHSLVGACACIVILLSLLLNLRTAGRSYASYQPLNLPGSGAVRVEPERVSDLHRISNQIRAAAGTLFTVPGAASLNLWTGVPPPTGFNFTNWIAHFPLELQEQIVVSLRLADRPVVVWNEALLEFWNIRPPYPTSPLLEYISRNYCRAGGSGRMVLLRAAADLAPGSICKHITEIGP